VHHSLMLLRRSTASIGTFTDVITAQCVHCRTASVGGAGALSTGAGRGGGSTPLDAAPAAANGAHTAHTSATIASHTACEYAMPRVINFD
jgi:hypothetical protein